MSKMSATRKMKKGISTTPGVERRNFNAEEIMSLNMMQTLINQEKFKASNIKANTALVPRGKEIAEECDAIARLLENTRNQYVSAKLVECGYLPGTRCDINFATGEIVLNKEQTPAVTVEPKK